MKGAGRARGTHSLRKRCPVCRKLRKFPGNEQARARRVKMGWGKVDGLWTCPFCLRRDPLLKVRAESARREHQIAGLYQRLAELSDLRVSSPIASKTYDLCFATLRRLQTEQAEHLRAELARGRHLDPSALDSDLADARQLLGERQ